MKENARTYDLLRQRDALRRSRQLWGAITVVWAVIVGWLAWGLTNAITDVADAWVTWLVVYLVPAVALAIVTLWKSRRIRETDAAIVRIAEERGKP